MAEAAASQRFLTRTWWSIQAGVVEVNRRVEHCGVPGL